VNEVTQSPQGELALAPQGRLAGLFPRKLGISVVREYGIVASFIAVFLILTFSSNVFLTKTNVLNMLDQTAPTGIMAVGGTLVFIAGGFDLSIGAVFAISGVLAAKAAPSLGPSLSLALGALVGLGFGVLNGLLVTIGRINAFIATLSTQLVIRGLAVAITSGYLIVVTNPGFSHFGQGRALGVTYGPWVWLIFALCAGVMLSRTSLGRFIYASGGNQEAARLSGVRVPLVRAITFAISGFSASLAGVLIASRVSTGQADAGTGIEFTVIAGIVIGGVSIFGGEGAIWRSVLGVLLLTMIGNGFNLLGINPIYSQVFQGGIILLAVAVDSWSRRST
jgi:ribose transport system permease protein